jgi:hypothetical protein
MSMNVNNIGIELFNSVLIDDEPILSENLYLNETVCKGFILQPEVAALPNVGSIIKYVSDLLLDGGQMNQTFHKSWAIIENSSEKELLGHQIMHYFSTYGMKALGLYSDSTIYIPNEVLNVPEAESLPLKVIKGLTRDEFIEKCLGLLNSGVALKVDTIDKVIMLLDGLEYEFKSVEGIKNKEAKLIIGEKYGIVYATNNTEFMRSLIYKATGRTTVITNWETLKDIGGSGVDIKDLCETYGLERLSQSFLRYKKLFMAFKVANPNNKWVVNRLRRLAKKHHQPMPVDYLNNLSGMNYFDLDELNAELDKVNVFRKIRVLYALHERMLNHDAMVYKIRNGKSFVKELNPEPVEPKKDVTTSNTFKAVFENAGIVLPGEEVETPEPVEVPVENKFYQEKYDAVYAHIIKNLNLSGTKIKYPNSIEYVLPTSEKQFVGNIPSGSYVDVDNNLIVGIYWENDWGATDLDLSMTSLVKLGWNGLKTGGGLIFSGDITDATHGATECFYIKKKLRKPHVVTNNIFHGDNNSKFKFFIAKEEVENLDSDYMVDPNNVIFQTQMMMDQRQQSLAVVAPYKRGNRIIITDYGTGNRIVSSVDKYSLLSTEHFVKSSTNKINLRQILMDAGCEFVEEDADIDLSVENLEKDTIMNLLKPAEVTV